MNADEVVRRIDLNYEIAVEIENSIIKDADVEKELEGFSFLGKYLAIYTTGVYSSDKLESALIEIGNREIPGGSEVPQNNKTLFVMTEASEGGGHSVLTANYIRWDDEEECSLAFTRMETETTPPFIKEAVMSSGGKIYYLEGDYINKARKLKELSLGFSKIVLLQHPEDIVPNLAYGSTEWKIPIFMYLHANFSFSYGFKIADRILTLNYYDIEKAKKFRGINSDRLEYFQFPNDGRLISSNTNELTDEIDAEYVASIAERYEIDTSKKIVVTMAEEFKLKDIVGCSFRGFVKDLLNSRDGDTQYIIIGPSANSHEWQKLAKDTNGNAKAVGYLKRKEACAIIKMSALYVVSFPMSASGNMIAEAFHVPFLTYALTERGRERQDPKTLTYSINELIEKANDILDGNGSFYILGERENILPQEDWKRQWKGIIKMTDCHRVHTINSQRLVENEELINCQLMQDRAVDEMRYYLRRNLISIDSMKMFADISRKYHMGVVSQYCTFLPEDHYVRVKKETILYRYINGWLRATLAGYSIAEYFISRDIKCIAIYGASVMGKNLYLALDNTGVEVECFIDRASGSHRMPAKVIGIDSVPQKSKVIINTAIGNIDQIRSGYIALTDDFEFISIFEIIEELCLKANI